MAFTLKSVASRPAFALPLALAACVAPSAPPPPPPAPTPRPAPTPAPVPPADWRDRAYTPGDWSYVRTGSGSEARYGSSTVPALTIVCDRAQLVLRMARATSGPLIVRTSYGDVSRAAQSSVSGVQLAFSPRDPLLDQIAYSRGRFMVSAGGVELVLPAWPEVARVIEDCR